MRLCNAIIFYNNFITSRHLFHISLIRGQNMNVIDGTHLSPQAKTFSFIRSGKSLPADEYYLRNVNPKIALRNIN